MVYFSGLRYRLTDLGRLEVGVAFIDITTQSKVRDFDHFVAGYEHITSCQVTMNHLHISQVVHSVGGLTRER